MSVFNPAPLTYEIETHAATITSDVSMSITDVLYLVNASELMSFCTPRITTLRASFTPRAADSAYFHVTLYKTGASLRHGVILLVRAKQPARPADEARRDQALIPRDIPLYGGAEVRRHQRSVEFHLAWQSVLCLERFVHAARRFDWTCCDTCSTKYLTWC